jgi:Uma2 family endonuclease
MGSLNHSRLQARLAGLFLFFLQEARFESFTELSLDISQLNLSQFNIKAKKELKPDVCVYPHTETPDYKNDKLKMSKMPLSAIEIVSPKQSEIKILNKFEVYFALGIKSCWLVTPTHESITVYYPDPYFNDFEVFSLSLQEEVFDRVLNIKLSLNQIFAK